MSSEDEVKRSRLETVAIAVSATILVGAVVFLSGQIADVIEMLTLAYG